MLKQIKKCHQVKLTYKSNISQYSEYDLKKTILSFTMLLSNRELAAVQLKNLQYGPAIKRSDSWFLIIDDNTQKPLLCVVETKAFSS